MDNQRKCTVCCEIFDSENPAVLTVSGFGNARYVCSVCEALMDKATLSESYEEIRESVKKLGERSNIDVGDATAFQAFSELIATAVERGEKIKNGEYDFSLDSDSDGGFDEIPDELRETDEDRALDEKEEKEKEFFDKFSSWVCAGIIIGAVIFFLIRLIF